MSGAKIGLHLLPGSGDVSDLIRSAPWRAVKAVDRTDALAVARDAGIATRILRLYGIEQLDAPAAVARWLSQDLGATTHLQLVNEHPRGYDPAWQGAVIAGLRAGGYRGVCLVGGFATGTPSRIVGTPDGPHFPELEQLYGLLRQPGVALCLNAYAGILPADPRWAQWAPWTCFRHRLIVADLARQGIRCAVVIGESGGDNVAPETQGGGWRTRGWSAAGYLGLLAALDAGDQGDSAVVCRCIFSATPTPDWQAYDISPIAGQLAAYVRQCAGDGPETAASAPTRPDSPPSGQNSATTPAAPVNAGRKPLTMPVPPIDFRQLPGTTDCWCENIRRFFSRYGILLDLDTVFQAGKGYARPDGGEPADFPTFLRAVKALAAAEHIGVDVPPGQRQPGQRYLQTLEIDDFGTLWAALNDPDRANAWTLVIGEDNGDINPGENWQHYVSLLQDTTDSDLVNWYDPAAPWDGDPSQVTKEQLTRAIKDNWDPIRIGYGLKIVTA